MRSEAAFYPAWGRNTQGHAKSYFGLSEVITMQLSFSHLWLCNAIGNKWASWVPEDDVFCQKIQTTLDKGELHLPVFGMELSPVKSKTSGGLLTREIYCYVLVKNRFTTWLVMTYTACCILDRNCSLLMDVFEKDHMSSLCTFKEIHFVWAKLYCFSASFHRSSWCMWALISLV